MDSNDTPGEICVGDALEASVFDLLCPLGLLREHANRLNEVLVAVAIISNVVTQLRDDIKRIGIIELLKSRHDNLRELEAHEATTRAQHSVSFCEGLITIGHISDAKRDCIKVHGVTFYLCDNLSI